MRFHPAPAAAILVSAFAFCASAAEEKSAKDKAFDKSVELYKAEYPKVRTKALVVIADQVKDAQKKLSEAQKNQLDDLINKAQAELDDLKALRMRMADAAIPLPIEYSPGKTKLFSLDSLHPYLANGDTISFQYRDEKGSGAKPNNSVLMSYYTLYSTRVGNTTVTTITSTPAYRARTSYYTPSSSQKITNFQGYLANKEPGATYLSYNGQMLFVSGGTVEAKDFMGKPVRNPIVYMFDVKDVHEAAFPRKEDAAKEEQIAAEELAAAKKDQAEKELADKEEAVKLKKEEAAREAAQKDEKAKREKEEAEAAKNGTVYHPAKPAAKPAAQPAAAAANADPVVGVWTGGPFSSTFMADGSFIQLFNGNPEARGTWTRKDNVVVVTGEEGPCHFTFTVNSINGDWLTFHYHLTYPNGAVRADGDDRRLRAK